MKDVRAGVRRHVEDWDFRTIDREAPAKFPPVHPRHNHIGHHETQVRSCGVRHAERLPALSSLQYAVALIPQKLAHQPAHEILVLCNQDDDRARGNRIRLSHNRPCLSL